MLKIIKEIKFNEISEYNRKLKDLRKNQIKITMPIIIESNTNFRRFALDENYKFAKRNPKFIVFVGSAYMNVCKMSYNGKYRMKNLKRSNKDHIAISQKFNFIVKELAKMEEIRSNFYDKIRDLEEKTFVKFRHIVNKD